MPLHELDHVVRLQQSEHDGRGHVRVAEDRGEPDEGHQKREQRSKHVERAVGNVETVGVATDQNHAGRVHRQEVDDVDVATPGVHHVAVRHRRVARPLHAAGAHSLHEPVEGVDDGEDRNSLVVVGARDGPADVARNDGDEGSRHETGTRVPALLGQKEGDQGRVAGKEGGEEHAHVPDVNREVEEVQRVVNGTRGEHQTRVHGVSHPASKRVPHEGVEPVVERLKSVVHKRLRGTEVEVRVELVDDTLVANHREETQAERHNVEHDKDQEDNHHLRRGLLHAQLLLRRHVVEGNPLRQRRAVRLGLRRLLRLSLAGRLRVLLRGARHSDPRPAALLR
eukprot:Rhum_TRINITY_DN10757_c0_g2::Rhum_TRINITY_DN10757_c0_g2_i1::g.40138::m.40138